MAETEYWNPYHWQTEKPFNFAKDIVLPGKIAIKEIAQHHEHAVSTSTRVVGRTSRSRGTTQLEKKTKKTQMEMEERPWIGDFVGWNRPLHAAQGNETLSPRQGLLRWAKRYPNEMHIRQDVPYSEALRGTYGSSWVLISQRWCKCILSSKKGQKSKSTSPRDRVTNIQEIRISNATTA